MPQAEECTISLCPRCGRLGAGEQQSFLSLDGVLKGDIPPSAAVGFGFRALGGRPVSNANIVRNLGLRDPETGLLPHRMVQQDAIVIAERGVRRDQANEDKLFNHSTAAFHTNENGVTEDFEGPKMHQGSSTVVDNDEDLVQLYVDAEAGMGNVQ